MKKLIVFPVHNRVVILRQAIASIRYLQGDYDIAVWDNASNEPAAIDCLKAIESDGVRVIWSGKDLFHDEFLFEMHKHFFGQEAYDYVAEVTDTGIAIKGCIEEMERVAYLRDDFGMVTPTFSHGYRLPPGELRLGHFSRWYQMTEASEVGGLVPAVAEGYLDGIDICVPFQKKIHQSFVDAVRAGDGIRAADFIEFVHEPLVWETIPEIDGSCWAVKKSMWERIGSHNPRYKYGWSSHAEYAYRARIAGFHAVCARLALYWHWDHDYWSGYTVEDHERYAGGTIENPARAGWVAHVNAQLNQVYGSVDAAYNTFNSNFSYQNARRDKTV